MAAEPQTANLQADQMRCLVAWINTRNFYVDNVKMSAVTASDGFASYTHIEIICCDAKTRLLTHPTHYARSIQVTADGRIHVPQQLRQVAPSWSDADAGRTPTCSTSSRALRSSCWHFATSAGAVSR